MKQVIMVFLLLVLSGCGSNVEIEQQSNEIQPTVENEYTVDSLMKENYSIVCMEYYQGKYIVVHTPQQNAPTDTVSISVYDDKYQLLHSIEEQQGIEYGSTIITNENSFYIKNSKYLKAYDYDLNIIKEYSLDFISEKSERVTSAMIAISDDYSKVAYVVNNSSLYVRDMYTNVDEVLIENKIDQESSIGTVGFINQVFFHNDYVIFGGGYIHEKEFDISGSNVYGRISLVDKSMDLHHRQEIHLQQYDGTILVEDIERYDESYLGRGVALLYDVESNTSQEVSIENVGSSFHLELLSSTTLLSTIDASSKSPVYVVHTKNDSTNYSFIPEEASHLLTCYNPDTNKAIILYGQENTADKIVEVSYE